mmetsp:Transcript_23070/g.26536  ORF Transcript_23070/g.26536 Transcript_23070/m.26536 type:complete len:406 (-) Transcript_23070:81-1298(-)
MKALSNNNIIASRVCNMGIIKLNNPQSLNALNHDMVKTLLSLLPVWQSDETIRATLFMGCDVVNKQTKIKSVFCAGGDVKSIYRAGTQNLDEKHGFGFPNLLTSDFFRDEYTVNHIIASQSLAKPQISIWDGIVMGGGVGISVHGKYRVATENTLFAMPETGIGLFPDVGTMYYLSRLDGGLGCFIALTGARLKADDLIYAGIATHYVPSCRLKELQDALAMATDVCSDVTPATVNDCVGTVLDTFNEKIDLSTSQLLNKRNSIDSAFTIKPDKYLEDIIDTLKQIRSCAPNDFVNDTLKTIFKMSPTSLKVTLEGLKRAKKTTSIAQDLEMEFRMMQNFMKEESDFFEGVRAVLIDRSFNPKWNPVKISNLSENIVDGYFCNLGDHELVLSDAHEGESNLDSKL